MRGLIGGSYGLGRSARLEARDVTPLREREQDGVVAPLARVVALEPVAQPRCLGAHHRIRARVERATAPERLHADRILLELIGPAIQRALYDEAQERAGPLRAAERVASQHAIELL